MVRRCGKWEEPGKPGEKGAKLLNMPIPSMHTQQESQTRTTPEIVTGTRAEGRGGGSGRSLRSLVTEGAHQCACHTKYKPPKRRVGMMRRDTVKSG